MDRHAFSRVERIALRDAIRALLEDAAPTARTIELSTVGGDYHISTRALRAVLEKLQSVERIHEMTPQHRTG